MSRSEIMPATCWLESTTIRAPILRAASKLTTDAISVVGSTVVTSLPLLLRMELTLINPQPTTDRLRGRCFTKIARDWPYDHLSKNSVCDDACKITANYGRAKIAETERLCSAR